MTISDYGFTAAGLLFILAIVSFCISVKNKKLHGICDLMMMFFLVSALIYFSISLDLERLEEIQATHNVNHTEMTRPTINSTSSYISSINLAAHHIRNYRRPGLRYKAN